ncbi:hypothetical protein H4R24_000002 [Coemansia sp. RSA 988]|nr:hypothetical protein H4R24_003347 [Coemansia sp. RSA 988]KAJ2084470.1 hypothetical protein H4R24_000002 [Coemansia sp. RSA 988]
MKSILTTIISTFAVKAFAVHGSIIAGYAPGWKNIDNVDFSQYTHINLAYAQPLANGSFALETSYDVADFSKRVQGAGAHTLLALGGWSGSIYFSGILKDTGMRGRLVSGIVDCLKNNQLNGIDIDWVANECNQLDVQNDAANLLVFLKELHSALESEFSERKLIALGVGLTPFLGPDGPLHDVSEYARLVDYINILAYDINGPYDDTTGPNAPLNYQLGHGSQASLISAVDSWTAAGFPADKITAGLAFYGRAATATADMSARNWNVYSPRKEEIPRGDNDDGLWADRCRGKAPHFSGVWSFDNLRKQGILPAPEAAASPWKRYWDSLSLTPWLFNTDSKVFISYDDPSSIAAKANYIHERGLGGVTVYDITMDHNKELMDVIRRGIIADSPQPMSSQESPASSKPTSSVPQHPTSKPHDSLSSSTPPLPSLSEVTPSLSSSNSDSDENHSHPPYMGKNCGVQPQYKCILDNGRGPQFAVCAAGVWVSQQCSSGTACIQNGDYIYCDWAR